MSLRRAVGEMSKPKGPGGRPSLYRPEYCEQIVEHMSDGASILSFAAKIGVSRATIDNWAKEHPEFLGALQRGKSACAAWWESVGRNLAITGEGNAAMVIFGLKNMAADEWRDKQQHEHTGEGGGALKIQIVKYDDSQDS